MSNKNRRKFWSTIEEYENHKSVEAIKNEEFFSKPEEILDENNEVKDPSRRDFIKLSGAAAVLSMVSCAERPIDHIMPYVNAPEEIIPGIANYYASSCDASNTGVLIKTREGRPIQILPNELDLNSSSGLNTRAYATIYDLYEPDRAREPMTIANGVGTKTDWETAYSNVSAAIKAASKKVVLLSGTLNGATRTRLLSQMKKDIPNFEHVMIDANSNDQVTTANMDSFGTSNLPSYDFAKASVVVLLGGDPIADGREIARNAKGLADGRRVVKTKRLSRIHAFEATLTETGANADYRYSVKNEDMAKVAMAIAHELVINMNISSFASNGSVKSALSAFETSKIESELSLKEGSIAKVAKDLSKAAGASLVYSEGNANRTINGKALHVATNFLNSVLSNIGRTVDYSTNFGNQSLGSNSKYNMLLEDMNAGNVDVLMVYNANPAYFAGNTEAFASASSKVKTFVSFNDRIDETSKSAQYLLPSSHILETWGDREYVNGLNTIVQPTIMPIWDTIQFEESMMRICSDLGSKAFNNKAGFMMDMYEYTKQTWNEIYKNKNIAASFHKFWTTVVRDGVYDFVKDRSISKELTFNSNALSNLNITNSSSEMTLSVYVGSTMGDGSQNNNPYLMEAPDPVSKVTWDNFISMSMENAKELGLWDPGRILLEAKLVELEVNGVKKVLPVNIQPGMHKNVLTVAAGWGRTAVGGVGNNTGVNAYDYVTDGNFSGNTVKLTKVEGTYELANVQGHQYIDDEQRFTDIHDHHAKNFRAIVFEATLDEYKEKPDEIVHYHTDALTEKVKGGNIENMWGMGNENVHKYPGHKWGMVVDLNSCVGCNACTVACQIENNVPVVGKKEVLIGREMHWIRIDRYFVGDDDKELNVVNQPMMCQHCDNAPCETVCPVVATTHNAEGLNTMTYNRCVGTRYCANNCPYKVRRFNFHEYTKGDATKGAPDLMGLGSRDGLKEDGYDLSIYPMQLMLNPDITVREKGVMEKCTMCGHKIREAKYEAKLKGVSINDLGTLTTACETACPANAIIFGDMNDVTSEVAQLKKEKINFTSLGELNTEPSVSYIAQIRNQDEALIPDSKSTDEQH